jgi:nicotinamide riboside transporter PnuC
MSLPLYHLDAVGSAFALTGQWFVYKKRWWGWALCAVGNGTFLYVNASAHLWGMEPMTLFFVGISVWSAIQWRRS